MNYSNAVVSGMLGWLKGIANWMVNLASISGTGGVSFIRWVSDNWIVLLIVLLATGLILDWVVWMIRWRPYWVWFRNKRIVLDDRPKRRRSESVLDYFNVDDDEEEYDEGSTSRRKAKKKKGIDPDVLFEISETDPDAINFWQEDVFKTSDLGKKRPARKPSRR